MSLPNEFLVQAGKHLGQVFRAALLMPLQTDDACFDAVTRPAQSLWNSSFGSEARSHQPSTVNFWEFDELLTALHQVGITNYLAAADKYFADRGNEASATED
ncbi:hypothetical protein [Sinorhizobium meliloti]|uniref:hypothetical protein n=1 Tax=Rhizobium meliloti TaxID=382 RepID=UPI000FDCA2EC|nr:hypothetical protein [Sinorhizobium meliloti]RVH25076.1 hypothetical protein CN211_30565 [Sinorhizobium meliloti]